MSTHASGTTARQRSGSGNGSGAKGRGGESAMPRVLTDAERARMGLPKEESRSPEEEPLRSRGPIAGYRYDPRAPLDPYMLLQLYGEEHLGRALDGYSRQSLSEAVGVVQARHPSTAPKDMRSKNSMIRYITRMVTKHGDISHYGAEFLPEATGARAKNGQSQRSQAAKAARATARPPRTPKASISNEESLRAIHTSPWYHYDPRAPVNAYEIHYFFGPGQLRQALSGYSAQSLREAVAVVQQYNPGTRPRSMSRKQDMIDYMVERVSANPRDAEIAAANPGY